MTAHCLRRMRVRHHFHIRKAGYGPIQAGGLAVSKMFSKTRIEIGHIKWPVSDAEEHRARHRSDRRGDNDPGHGIVAMPPCQFVEAESVTIGCAGKVQRGDDFVFTAFSFINAMKEIISRYAPGLCLAGQIDRAIQRLGKRRLLRRRIRQSQRTTDGAAIADRIMRDIGKHACQKRYLTVYIGMLECPIPGHRANAHNALFHSAAPKVVNAVYINEPVGLRDPVIHHRNQALATCDDLAVTRIIGQKCQKFVKCGGTQILKIR